MFLLLPLPALSSLMCRVGSAIRERMSAAGMRKRRPFVFILSRGNGSCLSIKRVHAADAMYRRKVGRGILSQSLWIE